MAEPMLGANRGEQRRLRMGIAGIGQGGGGMLPAMASMPQLELVAGADINPLTRERFRDRYPQARAYASVAELCEDPSVEAVWVSSPNRFHCEHAVEALTHGKHVVCGKTDGRLARGGRPYECGRSRARRNPHSGTHKQLRAARAGDAQSHQVGKDWKALRCARLVLHGLDAAGENAGRARPRSGRWHSLAPGPASDRRRALAGPGALCVATTVNSMRSVAARQRIHGISRRGHGIRLA